MPIYGGPYGASASRKRTGYWNIGAAGGDVVSPAAPQPATEDRDPFRGPGSINFNLMDPQAAVEKAATESGDVFSGLKSFLFGSEEPDPAGKHGGFIGDVPVLGGVGRFVVGGALIHAGRATQGVGDIADRLASQDLGVLSEQFNALPDDSPAKMAAAERIRTDTGIFGLKGVLPATQHYMAQAIAEFDEEQAAVAPGLFRGMFRPAASVGDTISNMFGALTVPVRAVERGVAGIGRPGSGGLNQLQMIMAVGSGKASWTADDPGLTPVEQLVFDKRTAGEWTEEQALDYMASHGAGFAHSKALEIAGQVFLDPLMAGSIGASSLARLGKVGTALVAIERDTQAALTVAKAAGEAAKVVELEKALKLAQAGIRAKPAAAGNILGRLAQQPWTGVIARQYGAGYALLEGNSIGRMAKITRTIIDPLHAWSGSPRTLAAIEEGSNEVMHSIVRAHGEFTHIDTLHSLDGIEGAGRGIAEQYERGLAVYGGNVLRRVAGRTYRATQFLRDAEGLLDTAPFQWLKDAMANVNRRTMTTLEEEAVKFIKLKWSTGPGGDMENLADRVSTLWGGLSKQDWLKELSGPTWTPERLSLLHAATYGSAVADLHKARAAVVAGQQTGLFTDRLHELILLNKQTLTDLGAQGILDDLEKLATPDAKLALIEARSQQYPELRNFAGDPTSSGITIQEFTDFVQRKLNYLPGQIRDAERAGLPEALAEFDARTRGVFTIGFRPKEAFLNGLERDPNTGLVREFGDPWMDQVSDNLSVYGAVRESSYNVAGKPIPFVGKAARLLDATEAAGRTLMHGVTGKMVSTAAHNKFVSNVSAQYAEAGLTEVQTEAIWKALMAKVDDSENISGVRGLTDRAIWDAAKAVIPAYAERAGLTRRSLLIHVLDAYDGDLRHIGLTQKFTGKVKLLMGQVTGANTAGVVAEHVWPLLRFRLNAFFQLQEKIEPWVLNGWRGITPARGTAMNETDILAASVYKNYVDMNLVNMADNEIAELGRQMTLGRGMEGAAVRDGSVIGKIGKVFEDAKEIQGLKQLNLLRTAKGGLGREMRAIWEESKPGEWDQMLRHARAQAGELIDEDEFAIRLLAENQAANAIPVRRIQDTYGNTTSIDIDFDNAITTGQWSAPQSLGEMRALNMDHVATRLGLRDVNGRDLKTIGQIREALAGGTLDREVISRGLRDFGAHPDYIARVESSLRFSYRQFWDDVTETFALTPVERRNFESMFARFAEQRSMTPVEYMSQVYSPNIVARGEGGVGSLGALVEFYRGGRLERVPDLAQLVGVVGQSDIDDLYRQMGQIMSQHLDPSAKRAFLLEMNPQLMASARSGEILTDMLEIEEMFASGGADALSQRIMHFVRGQPGTGPNVGVLDEATGVAKIRNAATEWRAAGGRPRNLQRVVYADNPGLAQEVADAFDQLPPTYQHAPTPSELAARIDVGTVEAVARGTAITATALKTAEAARLPLPLRASYEAHLTESRKLYLHLADDLGITVKGSRSAAPYATADALRADLRRGVIKVPYSGYWHPLYSAEDLFIQRAVRDVFGYGQEANALGSHDAIMGAAAMYSDEARAVLLSDEFGRSAWEANNASVIEQAVAEPTTVAGYEARWGRAASTPTTVESGLRGIGRFATRSVGNGVRALPADLQTEMITTIAQLRNQFPGVPLDAIDVGPLPPGVFGATLDFELERPTIVVAREGAGWESDVVARGTATQYRESRRFATGGNVDAAPNVEFTVSGERVGDLYHEFGHAVDAHLHNVPGRAPATGVYARDELTQLMYEFRQSEAMKYLSEYAFNPNEHSILKDSDMFAELFDLAFNPRHSDYVLGAAIHPELQSYVLAFRKELKGSGAWVPEGVAPAVNPNAGRTVAEVNAAAPGTIRAEHRIGLLPQETLTRLTDNFLGSGRYAEANPDVARMAGYLNEYMQSFTAHALREGERAGLQHIFDGMSGMPVMDAVPYNLTEARLWDAVGQMMAAKFEDAFRLQYFAQNRSMLQRSINHPMFGLYPASYMWGKVGPELVKFMALEPFGVKTGAMLYSLANVQKAIAVQRQYDPDFDTFIAGLGESPALSFLGYMTPALPWDLPSSYPAWMREAAQQGLANDATIAAGGSPEDINFVAPLTKAINRLNPYSTTIPWAQKAGAEVEAVLGGGEETPIVPVPGTVDAAGNVTPFDLAEPVSATGLSPVLADQMRSLQALLGG